MLSSEPLCILPGCVRQPRGVAVGIGVEVAVGEGVRVGVAVAGRAVGIIAGVGRPTPSMGAAQPERPTRRHSKIARRERVMNVIREGVGKIIHGRDARIMKRSPATGPALQHDFGYNTVPFGV
jgi:hypothetical protein